MPRAGFVLRFGGRSRQPKQSGHARRSPNFPAVLMVLYPSSWREQGGAAGTHPMASALSCVEHGHSHGQTERCREELGGSGIPHCRMGSDTALS